MSVRGVFQRRHWLVVHLPTRDGKHRFFTQPPGVMGGVCVKTNYVVDAILFFTQWSDSTQNIRRDLKKRGEMLLLLTQHRNISPFRLESPV